NHNIDRAQRLDGLSQRGLKGGMVGNIRRSAGHRMPDIAQLGNPRRDRVGLDVAYNDLCAFREEILDNGAADSAYGASNESDSVPQSLHAFVPGCCPESARPIHSI